MIYVKVLMPRCCCASQGQHNVSRERGPGEPYSEQQELFAIVGSTRQDIVVERPVAKAS
ncbi:hypothetical protein ACN28S_42125 [Cystobacter fuscus]